MKNKFTFSVYVKNIIFPAILFSAVTGGLTGVIVVCYKWLAERAIGYSHEIYEFLRANPAFLPLAIAAVAAIALVSKYFYKLIPDARGGGIANAIAFVRGLVTFKWLRTMIGTLFSSLITFLIGTPLGNEGPSVLAGTAIGKGAARILGKKNLAWERYVMTGGACSGFAVATNAPVSGFLFAVEEAHHRLSPMIIMVAGASVAFSLITSRLFAPVIGVNPELFPGLAPATLSLSQVWIPALIGLLFGFLSLAFIRYFNFAHKLIGTKLKRIDKSVWALIIFVATVLLGFASSNFIGTGHHLILDIIEHHHVPIYMLVAAIFVRFTLIGTSASAGVTGGTFIPVLALGALVSSIIAQALISMQLVSDAYYQTIILLGMAACFAGMIKTPLTAMVFAMEALALSNNVLSATIAIIISFMITEVFNAQSINETIIEARVEAENEHKTQTLVDAFVTVQPNAFVVGKSIRDIFWPNNLFVLSVKASGSRPVVDEHGEKLIYSGDVLHVRYATYNRDKTDEELTALVGQQPHTESEWLEE